MLVAPNVRTSAAIISFVPLIHRSCIVCLPTARSRCGEFRCPILNGHTAGRSLLIHHEKIGRCVGGSLRMGSQIWSSQHNLWPLDGRAVAQLVTCCSATVHIHRANLRSTHCP